MTTLRSLVTSRREQLAAIAEAWLVAGASAFAVWSYGQPLAEWPSGATNAQPALVSSVEVPGATIGELRVVGLSGPVWQARLNADAALVSQLAAIEDELEGMTAELIESQDQLLALYDLTQSTRSHLDIDQTLLSLAHESARLVKADQAALIFAAKGRQPTLAQYPPAPEGRDDLLGLFRQLLSSGRDYVLNRPQRTMAFPADIDNLLFVPITIRGAQSAGLALINKSYGDFTSPDLKLARALSDQAGAQIENVLLYQETLEQAKLKTEMDLAADIQLRLLPQQTPQVTGLDISAGSRPALQVGGDFYHFIQRPNWPLIFTVGDVSGKGMSAALLMVVSRTIIANAAKFMPAPTPEGIMSRVNEDLYDDFTEVSMFATAFIGQYNHTRHELTYANAGHSPVIFCPAVGRARLLEADGTAIGVLPVSLCENQSLPFAAGDVLIVASDGFSEARNPGKELFGYDRLLRLAEDLRQQSAQEIRDAFFQAVECFGVGQPQDDDQTLIVLKGVTL
jgi:sigma-B regulation protein RsbU (phosphoserine phosphatase)